MYKILVPVDGSEESEKAITQAVHLAQLEQAKLIFYFVVNIQQAAISVHLCQEIIDSLTEEGNRILGEIKESLPEGLEYLKNSWEGDTQKYKANIVVKNIPLRITFEEIYSLLWRANTERVVLEICMDNEKDSLLNFKKAPFLFLDELVVRDSCITIKDIADDTSGDYRKLLVELASH